VDKLGIARELNWDAAVLPTLPSCCAGFRSFSGPPGTKPVAFLEMQSQTYKQTVEYDLLRSNVVALESYFFNEPALPFDQCIAFSDTLLSLKQFNHATKTRVDRKSLKQSRQAGWGLA